MGTAYKRRENKIKNMAKSKWLSLTTPKFSTLSVGAATLRDLHQCGDMTYAVSFCGPPFVSKSDDLHETPPSKLPEKHRLNALSRHE